MCVCILYVKLARLNAQFTFTSIRYLLGGQFMPTHPSHRPLVANIGTAVVLFNENENAFW